MSTPTIPTADQLAARRNTVWHQHGQPLLTLESLRAWINQAGLVLYTPRAQQLPAPAPTFVEAVLGTPNAAPTLAETDSARTLLARLVAEGSAVPLNLLGTTTETPDFLCSAAVFSYVFTLRGDKTWKQPPATSGAIKVSPLALATYEVLTRRVTLSAAELADELGKEVTESAVLRALSELWGHLRVLPMPQVDAPAQWELISTRFTRQIKAGANAGQPSALSALISLYLGMAVVATEDEIETILSPLTSRSRIRDVVHALMGARQLETIAIDGRTVLHIAGDLPTFAAAAQQTGEEQAAIEVDVLATGPGSGEAQPAGRITKFVPRRSKTGTGFARKLTARPEGGDRERRPFQKKPFDRPGTSRPNKPSFTKPWDENRPPAEASDRPRPARPTFGGRPTTFAAGAGGTRPTFRRDENSGPSRPSFTPRPPVGDNTGDRPPRKTFSKPGTFGRKRDESAGRPSFDRSASDSRPPRRTFTPREGASTDRPRSFSSDRPKPSFGDRPRPAFGAKPAAERRPGSYTPRPQGSEGFAARKPFTPRTEGFAPRKPFGPGASRPFAKPGASRDRNEPSSTGAEAPRKIYRKFDAPRTDKPRSPRPFNPDRPARPPSGDRTTGSYSKPPGSGKPRTGSKPPGTFAKFADGNKPFRKPGPGGKKFSGAKSPGKPFTGSPRPEYRKRNPGGSA